MFWRKKEEEKPINPNESVHPGDRKKNRPTTPTATPTDKAKNEATKPAQEKKEKPEEKQAKPVLPGQQGKTEKQMWQDLGITPVEVIRTQKHFSVKMDPYMLESVTGELNRALMDQGFNFGRLVTPKEMLGILCDTEDINRRRACNNQSLFNAMWVAIMREAVNIVKKEMNFGLQATPPQKAIEAKLAEIQQQALINRAQKRGITPEQLAKEEQAKTAQQTAADNRAQMAKFL